ncbi:MAG: cytochrome c [Bacteroidota bacterium]
MPAPYYLLFLSLLLILLHACVSKSEDEESTDVLVSVPDTSASHRTITVRRDMSRYPPGTDYAQGKELFRANCAVCHGISLALTGPALGFAWAKYEDDRDFMYAYTRNAPALTASGNSKAIALSYWGPNVMIAFPSLTDTMINSILAYAEIEATKGTRYILD